MAAVYPGSAPCALKQGSAVIPRDCEAVLRQVLRPRESSGVRFMLTSSGYCVRLETGRMLSPAGPRFPHPETGFLRILGPS